MIVERGQQDYRERGPALPAPVPGGETIPGLTWPTMTFDDRMTLWLGKRRGRDHPCRPRPHQGRHGRLAARGAGAVQRRSGRVRRHALCGDAYFKRLAGDAAKLRDLKPEALVPGRGEALTGPDEVGKGIAGTRAFLDDLFDGVKHGVAAGNR